MYIEIVGLAHDECTGNLEKMRGVPLFVDGRNVFEKDDFEKSGCLYKGVGIV